MEVLIGFLIAMAIGLTGIGGGTVTAPVLTLFLGMPPAMAVGTSLVFGAIVKLAAAPFFALRGGVNWRILAFMLAGGLPGVVVGSLLLGHLDTRHLTGAILAVVGSTVLFSACVSLYRVWRQPEVKRRERLRLMPWISLPIGLEVGFSSAGAGALGTVALMQFTSILPVQIVGTDLAFGLALSLMGGGLHLGMGGVSGPMVAKLVAGGIPGVLLGAYLAGRAPARQLRMGLSVWLLYLGSQLLYRGVGSMVKAW